MTIYCILDPTGDVVPGSVSENAREAWCEGIGQTLLDGYVAERFRSDQAAMELDGYRLGRASGVVFERVG